MYLNQFRAIYCPTVLLSLHKQKASLATCSPQCVTFTGTIGMKWSTTYILYALSYIKSLQKK